MTEFQQLLNLYLVTLALISRHVCAGQNDFWQTFNTSCYNQVMISIERQNLGISDAQALPQLLDLT